MLRSGMAISLVATEPEKVWYHTCASKGKGCTNTQLVDHKGCCIWHDERELFKAIQVRVGAGTEISVLDPQNLLAGREMMAKKYGHHKDAAASDVSRFHLELLRPAWHQLASLEMEAQSMFFVYAAQSTKARAAYTAFDR